MVLMSSLAGITKDEFKEKLLYDDVFFLHIADGEKPDLKDKLRPRLYTIVSRQDLP